jgi:hypothetical protein
LLKLKNGTVSYILFDIFYQKSSCKQSGLSGHIEGVGRINRLDRGIGRIYVLERKENENSICKQVIVL